jgi:hypothetical protein
MLERRLRLALLSGLAAVILVPVGTASATTRRLASPSFTPPPAFAPFLAPVRDRVLAAAPRSLAADEWWGGPITDSRGETFRFFVSRQYPVDEAARARWANFLAWALHGKEISKLTVYQAPIDRVRQLCESPDAEACYIVHGAQLIFPGDAQDPQEGPLNLSEILLHEYGHHIATSRRNDPWQAFDYGPKYWASFENICSRAQVAQVHPGDENAFYLLNPGEAFAETYRLLNVRRAQQSNSSWYASWGQPLPWRWQAFSHTNATLNSVEKDVLHPWTGSRTLTWSARTPRKAQGYVLSPTAQRRIYTPLDGTITLVLVSAPRGSYVSLVRQNGTGFSARRSITATVCGDSSMLVKVTTLGPRRRFHVTMSLP